MAQITPTNETKRHDTALAVALRKDPAHPTGGRVIAQARGALADEMRELARQHNIALLEDGDLAALLSAVELDRAIPVPAFGAIAGILTELYRANDAGTEDKP